MNTLLQSLAAVCHRERFTEKRLVVDNYHNGHQLLQALAECGESWLNVKVVTPAKLAGDVAGDTLGENGLQLAGEGELYHLTSKVLEEMRSFGALKYFAVLDGSDGQVEILSGALNELRMAGVETAALDSTVFVDQQKGEEIARLLTGYEQKLETEKLADQAALYRTALAVLDKAGVSNENCLYLIPEQLNLGYLSYRFIEVLTENKRCILPAEALGGLKRPAGFFFKAETQPESDSPFAWLYEQEKSAAVIKPDVTLVHAYGQACEVREVFRRLKEGQVAADRAIVCYTNGASYLPLIKSIAQSCRVQVTYGEGLPVLLTKPGQLADGLLDWIGDNYSSLHLYRLLSKSLIKIKEWRLQARLLRQAAVGWSRARYAECFMGFEEKIVANLEKMKSRGLNTHYLSIKLDCLPKLQELIDQLLTNIPDSGQDGTVPYDQFCSGLAVIISERARTYEEEDRAARESLLYLLGQEANSSKDQLDLRLACSRLRSRLEDLRTGAEGAKAGHLHVTSIDQADWILRPHTYVVGLSGNLFPGSGLQDAVLLDRERKAISPNLDLAVEGPKQNTYRLNRLLASRRGSVCLSFSCYDPVVGRPAFPATVMLQVYRLKNGKVSADYSDLLNELGQPAAYYPGNNEKRALAGYEWWLSLVLEGKMSGDSMSVEDCYPGIKAGLAAERERLGSSFTEYDGKINVDPMRVDPRMNLALPMSASSLEKMARCPFLYFLERLLDISVPEERNFDRWSWLDAMDRGTLLHRIYAAYLKQVCSGLDQPQADRALLIQLAETEITAWKKKTPPPSELVFRSEKNALLKELEVFLKCEEGLWEKGSIPIYLEVPFGRGAEAIQTAGIGLEKPLELNLPGGEKVLLRGNIDRIDRLPQKSEYQVWDFKTGGIAAYKRSDYIKQGRQIQHALYAIAAEAILDKNDPGARVNRAGYIFPTEKGEGELCLREQTRRKEALEAVKLLLDLISGGTFCLTHKNKEAFCNYCDYKLACRYEKTEEALQVKVNEPANSGLEPWRELQKYE